ncbi:FG-GAP repeat domain-containing protein, partial [Pseudovibrio denitrificans]|uniref:FG-GAP repeat domain-containing protein n=1 Tax=Pseudovibrio denitrificans TaxID=258256 RepID=UPI000B182553
KTSSRNPFNFGSAYYSYFDDFDGDRVLDRVSWYNRTVRIDRDSKDTTCVNSGGGSFHQDCYWYGDKLWIKSRRVDLSKRKKAIYVYKFTDCYENSKGRERCRNYDTTNGGLYEKLAQISDFDGDGIDDVISKYRIDFSRAKNKTWTGIPKSPWSTIGDFNGDGRSDISSFGAIRLSDGVSGFSIQFPDPPLDVNRFGNSGTIRNLEFADFNGDGTTDALIKDTKSSWKFYFSAGNKFIPGPVITTTSFSNVNGGSTADINGDGRADFVGIRKGDHTRLYLTRGDELHNYATDSHGDFLRDRVAYNLSDADGDGRVELITRKWAYKLISERPDMLVGVVLPSGGHLSASYTTYGGDTEDERWFPPVLTVLASLTRKPTHLKAFTTRLLTQAGAGTLTTGALPASKRS